MFKLIGCVLLSLLAASVASAQAPTPAASKSAPAAPAASKCAAKAVDKDGKPLIGAVKASFIRKCEADAAADDEDDSLTRQRSSRRR